MIKDAKEKRKMGRFKYLAVWCLGYGILILAWSALREQEWLWNLKTEKALWWQAFSTRWYYPALSVQLVGLIGFSLGYARWVALGERWLRVRLWLLIGLWVIFGSSLAVSWANNVVNLCFGRPIHLHGL